MSSQIPAEDDLDQVWVPTYYTCPYCYGEFHDREIVEHVKFEHRILVDIPEDYTLDQLLARWRAIGF